MDLSQLEVFLSVARERRFSRAAEKLFRTQSAVSQTIRKLELEIGEPLFDRSSRDGVLTDAGHVLQEYAEKLLNLRQDAQTALVEMRELQKGTVTITQLGAESFVAHIVASPYRDKVIEAFRRHKTPLHMDVELPTLQAIKRFVCMGNGVALVPEISVENEISRGDLVRVPVRDLHFQRKLRLVHRQEYTLAAAGSAFLEVGGAG